jgi:hypothetical protein
MTLIRVAVKFPRSILPLASRHPESFFTAFEIWHKTAEAPSDYASQSVQG